jgi:hypothetical protein
VGRPIPALAGLFALDIGMPIWLHCHDVLGRC